MRRLIRNLFGWFALLACFGLLNVARSQTPSGLCTPEGLAAAVRAGGAYSFDCDGVIQLSDTLVVSNSVTLDAAGHQVTLAGGSAVRLFTIGGGGRLNLVGLTLARGSNAQGGAILNHAGGSLQATRCAFVFNTAASRGGAIYNAAGADAVFSQCLWASNQVVSTNGAIGTLFGVASGRAGGAAMGGAIWNAGSLAVHRSILRWNVAAGGNGGPGTNTVGVDLYGGSGGNGGDAAGGALHSEDGTVLIANSTLHNNSAQGGQGGNGGSGGAWSTARVGGWGGNGGSARGAGICVEGGLLNMTNDTVGLGSLAGGRGGSGGEGGWFGAGGSIGRTGGTGGNGGSLFGAGICVSNAMMRLSHGTVADNSVAPGPAGSGGPGGGGSVEQGSPGPVGQTGAASGSGLANLSVSAGSVGLVNTLLGLATAPICHGSISDLGHNLCADGSCGFTAPSLSDVDPRLDPLAINGGDGPTFALRADSPAIDRAGDSACLPTDQRGVLRPQGPHCDIGAFEWNPVVRILKVDSSTVRISGSGIPGARHTLQSATHLGNWQDAATILAESDGSYTFPDQTITAPARFFRVLPQPPAGMAIGDGF